MLGIIGRGHWGVRFVVCFRMAWERLLGVVFGLLLGFGGLGRFGVCGGLGKI